MILVEGNIWSRIFSLVIVSCCWIERRADFLILLQVSTEDANKYDFSQ